MQDNDFDDRRTDYVPLERLDAVIVEETALEERRALRDEVESLKRDAWVEASDNDDAVDDDDARDTLPSLPRVLETPAAFLDDPKLSAEIFTWRVKNAARAAFRIQDFRTAALNILLSCLAFPILVVYVWNWIEMGGRWLEVSVPLVAAFVLGSYAEFTVSRFIRAYRGEG